MGVGPSGLGGAPGGGAGGQGDKDKKVASDAHQGARHSLSAQDGKDKEKKKYEPPPPSSRVGKKKKKKKGPEAASKLPDSACSARALLMLTTVSPSHDQVPSPPAQA